MSISGPRVWLSSLSPPSTSHLSAITNHWQAPAWNSEQVPSRLRVAPLRLLGSWEKLADVTPASSTAMQPVVLKAENAFPAATSPGASAEVRYTGREMLLSNPENRKPEAEGDSLSRVRLDKLNHSEPALSTPHVAVSPSAPGEVTPERRKYEQAEVQEYDRDNGDAMAASSDEGAGSSTEKRASSDAKTEKKKMKRFRSVLAVTCSSRSAIASR